MKEYTYKWFHIPSGENGIKVERFENSMEFIRVLSKWNKQQEKTWIYYPIEST
jgi:hypothetical protein